MKDATGAVTVYKILTDLGVEHATAQKAVDAIFNPDNRVTKSDLDRLEDRLEKRIVTKSYLRERIAQLETKVTRQIAIALSASSSVIIAAIVATANFFSPYFGDSQEEKQQVSSVNPPTVIERHLSESEMPQPPVIMSKADDGSVIVSEVNDDSTPAPKASDDSMPAPKASGDSTRTSEASDDSASASEVCDDPARAAEAAGDSTRAAKVEDDSTPASESCDDPTRTAEANGDAMGDSASAATGGGAN